MVSDGTLESNEDQQLRQQIAANREQDNRWLFDRLGDLTLVQSPDDGPDEANEVAYRRGGQQALEEAFRRFMQGASWDEFHDYMLAYREFRDRARFRIDTKPTPPPRMVVSNDPEGAFLDRHITSLGRPFPRHLHEQLPGKVGQLCRWINATARYPQPELALGNVLGFVGALVGRKIQTPRRLRTNVYAVGVAESGSGKDHSRQCVKRLASLAGVDRDLLGGESLASGQAIVAALEHQPSILFQLDEVGHLIAHGQASGSHLARLQETFMQLSGAASSRYLGAEYASRDLDRIEVQEPNACCWGTTTPTRFYAAINADAVTDGFLGRWLIFRPTVDYPDPQRCALTDPPAELVEWVQAWFSRRRVTVGQGNLSVMHEDAETVTVTPAADAMFEHFDLQARENVRRASRDRGLNVVWTRATEHAWRVALIVAAGCSDGKTTPVIDEQVAGWSIELVSHLVQDLAHVALHHVAANSADRATQKVLQLVREAGQDGLPKSKLLQASKMKVKELNEITQTLSEAGLVLQLPYQPARGPASITFLATK